MPSLPDRSTDPTGPPRLCACALLCPSHGIVRPEQVRRHPQINPQTLGVAVLGTETGATLASIRIWLSFLGRGPQAVSTSHRDLIGGVTFQSPLIELGRSGTRWQN